MNCTDFLHRLDEYLEGSLGIGHESAAAHVRGCAECRRRVARVRALRMALREVPVPEPRPDLLERAVARAAGSEFRARTRAPWPYAAGLALAASFALWLGFGWLPGMLSTPDNAGAVTITLHQPRMVQLAFETGRELRQAALTIRLPQGVELEGFPGQREVRWHTDLVRGVNVLSLPLVAVAPSGGSLVARLEYDERVTELNVPLDVAPRASPDARSDTCATADCTPVRKEAHHV